MIKPIAVLSTTVIPNDGIYQVVSIDLSETSITGIPHYIGHPTTKAIVESLGAIEAESKLFKGLEVGEVAICFAIKQGKSSRKEIGKTVDQEVTLDDLSIRAIIRLSEYDYFLNKA